MFVGLQRLECSAGLTTRSRASPNSERPLRPPMQPRTSATMGHIRGTVRVVMTTGVALALSSIVVPAQQVASTSPVMVTTGSRVRMWQQVGASLSVPVVGRVTQLGADSVAVQPDGVDHPVGIARSTVQRIESSAGQGSGSRAHGALTGAIIGALGGAVLGVIAGNIGNRNAPKFAVAGFGVGGAAGAGIGASVPTEGWLPAQLPPAAESRP
jgi:hypothetical protein